MKLKITQKHIKNGKRANFNYCPIALALKEKTHKRVGVGTSIVFINDKEYKLCNTGKNFINAFDKAMTSSELNKIKSITITVTRAIDD